ncbi:hypothetical protein K435DRAFT_853739 [Dendrothele bispora CBS 962.96]|uniref:Uncharacterized protein n=1 Tax=Dendrothele bispora (strain CBS 962.96) TaxID=1314807 RepID=A0A4S8MFR7_DENBC|nr:hypothetical protein K435DRAFT_853739 [Dendrothele bispora CBS 962.96]
MPNQDVAAGNRKSDEQRFEELLDFLESGWKLWVALKECWNRFWVLICNKVEVPRRGNGEGNRDGEGN